MKLYKVCAKCGHVGRNKYVEKLFLVKAETAEEAAAKVRWFPRVKHHHKDAIRDVEEISYEEYSELKKLHDEDPYFSCKNVQDQRSYEEVDIEDEAVDEFEEQNNVNKSFCCGKEVIRNPKKYMNRYYKERYVA